MSVKKNSEDLQRSACPDYTDDTFERTLPGPLLMLRPRLLVSWLWDFVSAWWYSRSLTQLVWGIPFLVVAMGCVGLAVWLRATPQDDVVSRYEQAVTSAVQAGDFDSAILYQEAIVQQRPSEDPHRLKLAILLAENARVAEALPYFSDLTGPAGYVPARLWLVQQAQKQDPLIPLTPEQIEQQLRAAVKRDAGHLWANQQLAQICLQKGDLKEAEDRLQNCVEQQPELRLLLADVQRRLNRSEDTVRQQLTLADEFYTRRLLEHPADETTRIRRAECLFQLRQFSDAERILSEGLSENPSPQLRSAMAGLYSGLATDRLQASVLNCDTCAQFVSRGLQFAPDHPVLLRQALHLSALGAQFSATDLQPALDLLQQQKEPNQRLLLAQLLSAVGQTSEALGVLQPLADASPEQRLPLVRLLKKMGQDQEAQPLIDQLLTEAMDQVQADNPDSRLNVLEIQLLAGQLEEAWQSLDEFSRESSIADESSLRRLKFLQGQAGLAVFEQRLRLIQQLDQATVTDEAATAGQLQELFQPLDVALEAGSVSIAVIDRLAKLSCTDSRWSGAASEKLTRLLASGNANASVYNMVGTHALTASDIEKARRFLERAYALEPGNPMVLNNLSVALVRGEGIQADRALNLANSALERLPGHPDVLSTRAEVYMAQENWEAARTDLEKSLPFRQDSRSVRALLVKVFQRLDEPSLAAEHQRILDGLPAP